MDVKRDMVPLMMRVMTPLAPLLPLVSPSHEPLCDPTCGLQS